MQLARTNHTDSYSETRALFLGGYWCGSLAELVAFARRLGAPGRTTTKCKGVIPEDHPLRAGCIIGGLIERKLVMEADLIVTVGLDAVELQPKPWPYTLPVLWLACVPSVDPDRPVVAFTGDGGFLMTIAELQTARRENLPIIVLVFDDQEVGLIRVKQEIKGIAPHGVKLGGVPWEKLAHAFGADGVTVDTEQGLMSALTAALQSKRTTVIGVHIDASGYVAQFNALREL